MAPREWQGGPAESQQDPHCGAFVMRPTLNGVSIYAPSLTPLASKQLDSLIARASFHREQFGEMNTLTPPPGTRVILAFGEEALRLWTGEVNIMRHRGHVLGTHPLVVPTFEPAMLLPKRGEESS